MSNKKFKKLDRNTLGATPACVYLVDFLNQHATSYDRNVLKYIASFRKVFTELEKAYEQGAISASTVRSFISAKRLEVKQTQQAMAKQSFSPIVPQLYANIVIADMKHFIRYTSAKEQVIKSAIQRAKNSIQTTSNMPQNFTVHSWGSIEEQNFEADITFEGHKVANINIKGLRELQDEKKLDFINAHTLQVKANTRQERRKLK